MWDKILPWIGGIFAAVGLILIFCDVISSIKRRNKTKTNIAGLIILTISVVGYIVTDLILVDSAWPPLASLIWIALFWVYVIMDAVVTLGVVKKYRRDRKSVATKAKQAQPYDDVSLEAKRLWEESYAHKMVSDENSSNKRDKRNR